MICLDFKFYKRYMIWVQAENDTVLTNDSGKIISFENYITALKFASENGIEINDDRSTIEVFHIQQWLINPSLNPRFKEILDFWNICTDFSESTGVVFAGDIKGKVRNNVFDKLYKAAGPFLSDNRSPLFTGSETVKLVAILEQGLKLFSEQSIVIA